MIIIIYLLSLPINKEKSDGCSSRKNGNFVGNRLHGMTYKEFTLEVSPGIFNSVK